MTGSLFANSSILSWGRWLPVEAVNTVAIEGALSEGLLPVVAPIGRGIDAMKFNVNADWAAAKIAIALKADKLIFLTDQDGILGEKKRLIRRATPLLIQQLISDGIISGGMCTKANAMMSALRYGVTQVRVLNANQSSQIFLRPRSVRYYATKKRHLLRK